jgi:hypothetical protein
MSTENRTIDLTIDKNVPFGMLLSFSEENTDVFPPTNTVIDLTDFTMRGTIKNSLEANAQTLGTFTATILSASGGLAQISLTAAQATALSAAASDVRDKYNPRLRFVGYYDVLMTRGGNNPSSFRVLEGTVYISDGVTT